MRPEAPPRALLIGVGCGPELADVAAVNFAEIGRVLARRGALVLRAVSVPGDASAIRAALAGADGDLCVIVGGVGPGTDDVAAAALAGVVDDRRHADDLPAGAVGLPGPSLGEAGFTLEADGRSFVVLPGAAAAVRALADAALAPVIAARWPGLEPRRRTYRVMGPSPSEAAAIVRAVIAAHPGGEAIAAAIAGDGPELLVHLRRRGGEAPAELTRFDGPLLAAFGEAIHGIGDADLATRLVGVLIERGLRIASAESCTGGRVAARITAVPGASACIHGAIVAYDNAIKERALGVPAAILRDHGAVSEPVARAMAAGVRRAFPGHVDLGVGITGIAGPGGGSAAKPVGTVDFAVDDAEGSRYRRMHLVGDRPAIQEAAAIWALRLCWDRLRERGLCGPALVD